MEVPKTNLIVANREVGSPRTKREAKKSHAMKINAKRSIRTPSFHDAHLLRSHSCDYFMLYALEGSAKIIQNHSKTGFPNYPKMGPEINHRFTKKNRKNEGRNEHQKVVRFSKYLCFALQKEKPLISTHA